MPSQALQDNDSTLEMKVVPSNEERGVRKVFTSFFKKNYASHHKTPSTIDLVTSIDVLDEELTKKDFLIRLAKALHIYGSPVYRTEYAMTFASAALGIEGMFAIFPTLLITSFGDIERINFLDAQQELNEIINAPSRYHPLVQLLCSMVCSGCISLLFFHGGWAEFIFSILAGLIVGLLVMLVDKFPVFDRLLAPVAATVVSFVAKAGASFVPGFCFYATVLSGIIWLLPGLSLTIAVMELSTRNVVSGSSRMFYAFLMLLELGFGIALGNNLVVWDHASSPTSCSQPSINPWWFIPLFLGTVTSINVLLSAHPRQWPPMTIAAAIGVFVPYGLTGVVQDANLISFLGSFGIGIFGTIYSRLTKHPSIVAIIAGIITLVPGSVGVRGVAAVLLSNDIVSGLNFTFQMMFISLSITGGLLFAHLLVFPKQVLAPTLL